MKQFKAFKESNTHGFFEGEIAIALRELGEGPFICIADCTDDEGHWMDEIWDERDIGWPKREPKMYQESIAHTRYCWWKINVWGIGEAVLFQDASPIGFVFREKDVEHLNIEYV